MTNEDDEAHGHGEQRTEDGQSAAAFHAHSLGTLVSAAAPMLIRPPRLNVRSEATAPIPLP